MNFNRCALGLITQTCTSFQKKTVKPIATLVSGSSIKLSWDPDPSFIDDGYYEISLKEGRTNKWVVRNEEYKSADVILSNLNPETQYQFRVRYKCGDIEGQLSQPSDPIKTEKNEVY